MIDNVLLNLLTQLGEKRDKMRILFSILSLLQQVYKKNQ